MALVEHIRFTQLFAFEPIVPGAVNAVVVIFECIVF